MYKNPALSLTLRSLYELYLFLLELMSMLLRTTVYSTSGSAGHFSIGLNLGNQAQVYTVIMSYFTLFVCLLDLNFTSTWV